MYLRCKEHDFFFLRNLIISKFLTRLAHEVFIMLRLRTILRLWFYEYAAYVTVLHRRCTAVYCRYAAWWHKFSIILRCYWKIYFHLFIIKQDQRIKNVDSKKSDCQPCFTVDKFHILITRALWTRPQTHCSEPGYHHGWPSAPFTSSLWYLEDQLYVGRGWLLVNTVAVVLYNFIDILFSYNTLQPNISVCMSLFVVMRSLQSMYIL